MRDYAELVKTLRFAFEEQDCGECALAGTDRCAVVQSCRFKDAADAIEELIARDVVPMDFHERCLQLEIKKRIELEKQLPQWISVEERLPEFHMNDSGCVCTRNIVFRTEYKTVHLGYVIRTAHNIEMVDGFEKILVDRWHDQTGDMIEDVTHWMPLPEPPKEVE